MSAVAIVRSLLLADGGVKDVMGGAGFDARVIAGVLPRGTPLPAIALTVVTSNDHRPLKKGLLVKVTARVQVTICADSYPEKEVIMLAVRRALREYIGSVNGHTGVAVGVIGNGPDFKVDDAEFVTQSCDVSVAYDESA